MRPTNSHWVPEPVHVDAPDLVLDDGVAHILVGPQVAGGVLRAGQADGQPVVRGLATGEVHVEVAVHVVDLRGPHVRVGPGGPPALREDAAHLQEEEEEEAKITF